MDCCAKLMQDHCKPMASYLRIGCSCQQQCKQIILRWYLFADSIQQCRQLFPRIDWNLHARMLRGLDTEAGITIDQFPIPCSLKSSWNTTNLVWGACTDGFLLPIRTICLLGGAGASQIAFAFGVSTASPLQAYRIVELEMMICFARPQMRYPWFVISLRKSTLNITELVLA